MKIYLDNCCFNRPFDDQSHIRIRLEAEAKLFIQENIQSGKLQLVWSYILDFENQANPFEERRNAIALWKKLAVSDLVESKSQLKKAHEIHKFGIKNKDALHVACAIDSGCGYFLTTDDLIIRKLHGLKEIIVASPITFINRWSSK